jgi:sugar lactone lactonase YvrE
VQLLLNDQTNFLYIGSTGNASVVRYDLSHGAPAGTVQPEMFIDSEVKHISGMAFDADGNFYAAERKKKSVKKFAPDGSKPSTFIDNLPDDPEFILYVPKDDS